MNDLELVRKFTDGTLLSGAELTALRTRGIIQSCGVDGTVLTPKGRALSLGNVIPEVSDLDLVKTFENNPLMTLEAKLAAQARNLIADRGNGFYLTNKGRAVRDGKETCGLEPVKSAPSALDVQFGGSHYKNLKIQPVEFITANNLGFLEGCIIKRICRYKAKNGIEDLEKAKHEIDLLIELGNKNGN